MTTIKAHFDGKVIIPDEPVDLPTDRPLAVQVEEEPEQGRRPRFGTLRGKVRMSDDFDEPLEDFADYM